MSATDGILRAFNEVHCRLCEVPELGLPGRKVEAKRLLLKSGWRTVQGGVWICPTCAEIVSSALEKLPHPTNGGPDHGG